MPSDTHPGLPSLCGISNAEGDPPWRGHPLSRMAGLNPIGSAISTRDCRGMLYRIASILKAGWRLYRDRQLRAAIFPWDQQCRRYHYAERASLGYAQITASADNECTNPIRSALVPGTNPVTAPAG